MCTDIIGELLFFYRLALVFEKLQDNFKTNYIIHFCIFFQQLSNPAILLLASAFIDF